MQSTLFDLFMSFSTIAILLQVVEGNSFSFLRTLAQEEAEEEQRQLAYDDMEQTNMITDYGNRYTPTSKKSKEWIKVEFSGSPHSRILSKGQYYELTCKSEGRPGHQIYWMRGDNIQRQLEELKKTSLAYDPSVPLNTGAAKKESKYVIDCASKEDEGPIHCVAVAGDKLKWESTIIFVSDNVTTPRSRSCGSARPPVITHHATTVVALQGTSVILPCVATGKPRPYITWETSDGSLITNQLFNPRYKVLGTGNLLIDALEWDDMNEYTCVASSNSGEDRVSTFIYPAQRDDKP